MDLVVVELSHFHALLVSHLGPILVLNLAFDQIVKGEDVPSVVGLGLDLALGTRLKARLRVIEPVMLVLRKRTDLACPATPSGSIARRLI